MGLKDTDIRDLDLFKSKQKKPVRFLTKRGINLAADHSASSRRITMILSAVLVVLVVFAVAKFGVYDVISRRDAAAAEYQSAHAQLEAAQKKLESYDEVLLEYRTYSMDWMENDTSGKYVSVARREILDMVEQKMMPVGEVTGIQVEGDYVTVTMNGESLKEISKMCNELEEIEFVEDATLETAATTDSDDVEQSENLTFVIVIQLHSNVVAEEEE